MSRTPAAELARLKVTYQGWIIERTAEGSFAAERRDGRGSIQAVDLAELETALMAAER